MNKLFTILIVALIGLVYLAITTWLYTMFPWVAMLAITFIYGSSNGQEKKKLAAHTASFILTVFSAWAVGSLIWFVFCKGNYINFTVAACISTTLTYLFGFVDGRSSIDENYELGRHENMPYVA